MANYTDEEDRIYTVVAKALERDALHGVLAKKVALELGSILEPMIKAKVRECLAKTTVKFDG